MLLLIVRICLSAVFLYSGLTKLLDPAAGLAEMRAFGLPLPAFALAGTIVLQLAGGMAILAGTAARTSALMLAAFTLAATLLAHDFWNSPAAAFTRQLTVALEHLAIVGGLLLLSATGPGGLRIATPLDRLDGAWHRVERKSTR